VGWTLVLRVRSVGQWPLLRRREYTLHGQI